MKPTDKISVLICVHSKDDNHDKLLGRALESLARQTFFDFELIVVLDECWEYTKQQLFNYENFFDLKYYERPHKQGLAVAKNFGLKHCTGDWVAFLDADDQFIDCKLELQRNFLLENPSIDFCGTQAWDLANNRMTTNCFGINDYVTHDQIAKRIWQENVMCHGSMMIRKSALDALNGYRTDKFLLGREDWDLWQRAFNAGFNFAKLPERLYIYSMGTSVER